MIGGISKIRSPLKASGKSHQAFFLLSDVKTGLLTCGGGVSVVPGFHVQPDCQPVVVAAIDVLPQLYLVVVLLLLGRQRGQKINLTVKAYYL